MTQPTEFSSESAMQLRVQLWSVNLRATKAEESPLPRFVTRKDCRGIGIVKSGYQVKTGGSILTRPSVE
jgi:hypothetical protein